MLSAWYGDLAVAVSKAFGGPFYDADVIVPGVPVYGDGGSIVTPAAPTRLTCSAQVDAATEAMRQAEGFTEKDVRLLVLDLADEITTGMKVDVQAGPSVGLYTVQSATRDPVGIGWEIRGRKVV